MELMRRYHVGTSKHWQGATVFWQKDCKDRVRTGKIILYNPQTGKRVKQPFCHVTWVHSALHLTDFNLRQCFFGEHLLTSEKNKPVGLVESEKTALVCSIHLPHFTWIARADCSDVEEICWYKKDDMEPKEIPNSGCGSWALLEIKGEPTTDPIKVLGLDDPIDFGKYKGRKLSDVIIEDWQYVKWAVLGSQRLFVDVDEIIAYHEDNTSKLKPTDIMTFGKYKGRTLQEVFKEDHQYLRWLEDNNNSFRVDWAKLMPRPDSVSQ